MMVLCLVNYKKGYHLTTINLITPLDKFFGDNNRLLILFPSQSLQNDLQNDILNKIDDDLDIYVFQEPIYEPAKLDWLMTVFHMADTVIVDIDNCAPYIRDLLSFMIAKSKTYWLTNGENSVYNHLSNKRIFNLESIQTIGDISVKTAEPKL